MLTVQSIAGRFVSIAALSTCTVVQGALADEAKGGTPGGSPAYLRVDSVDRRSISLEVAAHRYRPAQGEGPEIALVGVVHIGDDEYYRRIQTLLDQYEVVLFESVKPAGTGGASGDTPEERVESTLSAMDFLARAAASYRRSRGDWPVDLAAIEQFLAEVDPRLPSFFHAATQDAWRRAIHYECCMVTSVGEATGKDTEPKPRLVSLGADGEPGGRGVDADLQTIPDRATLPLSQNEGNIQSELAEALNLAFQLEAIDYSHPSWRCSDMAIDQLKRELDRRGADFTVLEDTLAGTSFSGRIARILLQAVRLFDRFTDGAVSDTVKVVLIEMLADESLIEMSMQQFDPALMEVLIDERNQVVIDDLQQVLREQPGAQSIAVFYGAGHMQDLAERLRDQLGYAHEGGRWFKAISVDLTESAVSQREVLQMRLMIRRMMRQMSRMPRADSP